MWASSPPLSEPHRRANPVVLATKRSEAPRVVGIGAPPQKLVRLRSLAKQDTRVLRPEPRRSQLTTSKRPENASSRAAPPPRTASTPEPPGPPGLMNSEPIRWPGLDA